MKRLLFYVHFNKYNRLSSHVSYQLEQLRPLFEKIVFISNSQLDSETRQFLAERQLVDDLLVRENKGFDFAAVRDGMAHLGFTELTTYDSVTLMNDTCFGPLWDLKPIYQGFEADEEVDFWGMTNFRATQEFHEHLQSYFLSFKQKVSSSPAFQDFWQGIQDFTDVQDVIDNYESEVTTVLVKAGFKYKAVFNTVGEDTTGMLHPDFTYYNPTAILNNRVPFIKVKTIDANSHIAPYLLDEIERTSDYPVDLILSHMSMINPPDSPYLLARKYISPQVLIDFDKKVAVHLHVFYVDLLQEFLDAFENFHFSYDLFITTDLREKSEQISQILSENNLTAEIFITGNVGRDVLPMLKLKERLKDYDYIGHFHTKKSKEADFWAGESWRKELIEMMIKPADRILANMEANPKIGITIADIPSFFRFNRIVVAWNEHEIAEGMNQLWERMGGKKTIDFETFHNFVMSYGTFVWFQYDALKPLFDLNLTDEDVPAEPLPQNSILHAIERLLIYIAWDGQYDFRISANPVQLTPFIDNKLYNLQDTLLPHTFVDFNQLGGIKGALKYIVIGPARAVKYIVKRLGEKVKH